MDTDETQFPLGFVFSVATGFLGLVAVAYFLLVFEGGGSVSKHVGGGGFSSSSSGYTFGMDNCNLGEGKSVRVDYELKDRRSGELNIYLMSNGFFQLPKIVATHKVVLESKGSCRLSPPKPGRYRIVFSPIPDGKGYDFSYAAKWKVE